jgi:predicted RNA binding protein YcfA (HicA-like mRNA interferase family)
MLKLRVLSGKEIVKIFSEFGFEIVSQRGSHVKLRRILKDGTKQTLTIPLHKELDKGTIRAIFRQALKYISEDKLKPLFYSDDF